MRDRVGVYEHMMTEAFESGEWGSLLGNLASVPTEAWEWVPERGGRSIRAIVHHVGGCKAMYANHAFGDASLRWSDPFDESWERVVTIGSAVEWLREMHALLTDALAGMEDHGLDREVRAHWGAQVPASVIFDCMLQHDVYHAGEINLVRSLYTRDDSWSYESEAALLRSLDARDDR